MSKPMTPETAREALGTYPDRGWEYNPGYRALETIAGMTVEEDWRLVSTEQNGGLIIFLSPGPAG